MKPCSPAAGWPVLAAGKGCRHGEHPLLSWLTLVISAEVETADDQSGNGSAGIFI